ncbi:MAG TPA: 4Fe-4S dicluster domain-containing protein [Pseudomonadota bacterium]|nr:4Fe-4S dicluster domain-containing protein [Pseudomonadota bacterium]
MHDGQPEQAAQRMEVSELAHLIDVLWQAGYRVLGPTVGDGAIVHGEVRTPNDLPVGIRDEQNGGHYRLVQRGDGAFFGHNVGPHSLKRELLPPRERLFSTIRRGKQVTITNEPLSTEKIAFLGAKACELSAMLTQDRVFLGQNHPDAHYAARRRSMFIVGVSCTQAGGTCFCTSMGTGPRVDAGADLALVEVVSDRGHYFLIEAKTPAGHDVAKKLALAPASVDDIRQAELRIADATTQMGRHLSTSGIKEQLAAAAEHPHWDDVASRCLSCANCTLVCPTCFCNTVEDVTDLEGDHSERWRRWDSCFHEDFSYLHGGSVRHSVKSRYRQWMTHKLSTWIDQFGQSGCVGCGRCITFCPVGIDITAEVLALKPTSP